jgi:mRNA-degrading endonuclease RelE of RelBE toxin-antitoxin system
MRSRTTARFRKALERLPTHIRDQARAAFRVWTKTPYHPALRFKRVHPVRPFYAARVGLHYRAVALVDGEDATWFWIGTHEEYNKLLTNL